MPFFGSLITNVEISCLSGKSDNLCGEIQTIFVRIILQRLRNGDQTMLNGKFHQTGKVMNGKLLHEATAVGINTFGR